MDHRGVTDRHHLKTRVDLGFEQQGLVPSLKTGSATDPAEVGGHPYVIQRCAQRVKAIGFSNSSFSTTVRFSGMMPSGRSTAQ